MTVTGLVPAPSPSSSALSSYAKDGVHKPKDRDAADGVDGEQARPQRVGDRGDKRHVDDERDGGDDRRWGRARRPSKSPMAVRTRPPTKNCQPASKTPSCSREKMPIRQVERAPATVEARIKPSPSSLKPKVPSAPERLTSATPAKPSAQPSTLAVLSFSVRNARAAKRIARKLALASMMELDMALARERPR